MLTKTTAAPNATIDARLQDEAIKRMLNQVKEYAHRLLGVSSYNVLLDPTGTWRFIPIRTLGGVTYIQCRVRTDIIRDVDVHEWSNGECLIHFILTTCDDRSYADEAKILKIIAA